MAKATPSAPRGRGDCLKAAISSPARVRPSEHGSQASTGCPLVLGKLEQFHLPNTGEMKTANTHRLTSGGGGSPPKTLKSVLSLDRKPKKKKKTNNDLHRSALRQHQSQRIFQRKGAEVAENPSCTRKPADRNRSHHAQHWGPLSPTERLARAALPTGSWRAPLATPSTSRPLGLDLLVTQTCACCPSPMRSCFKTLQRVPSP